jgi:hypothetical protein
MSRLAVSNLAVVLAVCAQIAFVHHAFAGPHDALIAKHAAANGVPEHLVRRVIRIESRGNAAAVHAGNYGLMQIRLETAKGMGYSGDVNGLLDPETNLTYAVRYLAGAYRAAGCDADRAVSYYQRGYYGAPQRECSEPTSALLKTAQAEAKQAAKSKRDVSTAPVADVIKPKVVRTETIIPAKSGAIPAAPAGKFEPPRIALPASSQPVAKTDVLQPATTEPVAKFELASVPLPPARPELEPASKLDVQPVQRSGRAAERTGKKFKIEAKLGSKTESKTDAKSDWRTKTDDPIGVVSFLKKLVTLDTKPRKQPVEADADPPPQVPPPQY